LLVVRQLLGARIQSVPDSSLIQGKGCLQLGIIRYPVECPGCEAHILLRLGVGHESRQRFYYVCPKCKAATRGALLWHGDARTELELADGRRLETDENCVAALSINPELPSFPEARSMSEFGGSPWITFTHWLGPDGIRQYQKSFYQIRHLVGTDWAKLDRLTTYYLNRDWPHFDQSIGDLLPPEALDFSVEWARDDRIHRLYEIFFAAMWGLYPPKHYLDLKFSWSALWTPTRSHFRSLVGFAQSESTTLGFRNAERDVFSQLARFTELIWGLFPGLLLDLLPQQHQPQIDNLRLFRDEYEVLRDFYIQVFETSHKVLRWIVGTANADRHGDPNTFVAVAGMSPQLSARVPKNLDAFSKLTSANKRAWLSVLPEWHDRWDDLLDRHLRNDIGHASARHDLSTGMILRDGRVPLPYTRFVQRLHRVLHLLLASANALKYIRIYSHVKP
jgi:hypothetical protein